VTPTGPTGNNHQRPKNVLVVNNTFVDCQYSIGVGLNYTLAPQNCTVANNVVVGSVNQLFKLSAASESENTCTYGGNIAYATGSAILGTSKPVIAVNPLLAASSFNGYTLKMLGSGSPAINASVGSYVTDDVFGGARSGTPDIGADEFGSANPRSPMNASNTGPNA